MTSVGLNLPYDDWLPRIQLVLDLRGTTVVPDFQPYNKAKSSAIALNHLSSLPTLCTKCQPPAMASMLLLIPCPPSLPACIRKVLLLDPQFSDLTVS